MDQPKNIFHERFWRLGLVYLQHTLWLALSLSMVGPTRAADASKPGHPPGGAVVVPLVRATFGHFGLDASVDGQPAFLMLDTGSPVTILDTGFYRQNAPADAALRGRPKRLAMATLHHRPAIAGWVDDVRAGAMNFGGTSVAVTDLGGISGAGQRGYRGPVGAGILGADILTKNGAVVDWGRRRVSFSVDPGERMQMGLAALRDGWTAVPMEFTNGHHFAVACTLGRGSYHLIVDTGAAITQIDQSLWDTADITQGKRRGYLTGLSSNTLVTPVVLTHWSVGTFPMEDSLVAAGKFKGSLFHETTRTPGRVMGVLGSDWLAARAGIIDLDGMTLYLK